MATYTPIQLTEEPVEVTQITPVDLTAVRDPGIRALVLLAVSLGWNAIQKVNNPIALVARDGIQRRLPTNTSIRMSVFQTALSSIIAHTEDRIATPELIDVIIHETKVDRDHARRLRLAIGETAEEHRQRLANDKVAEQRRQSEEHLTQQVEVPVEDDVETEIVAGPVDGGDHGQLMSRAPFMAHHQSDGTKTHIYQSDTSYERVWGDRYIDYECMNCGKAYASPKGVGAHSQVHTRSGEKDNTKPAWQRAVTVGTTTEWKKGPRRTKAAMKAQAPPAVDDIVFEMPPSEDRTDSGPPVEQKPAFAIVEVTNPGGVIDQIAALVSPQLVVSRDTWKRVAQEHEQTIDQLQAELGDAVAELEQVKADWEALKGLLNAR